MKQSQAYQPADIWSPRQGSLIENRQICCACTNQLLRACACIVHSITLDLQLICYTGQLHRFLPRIFQSFSQLHSGVSCKFLILLKLLLGWKRNSPPFMLVSCTNQDAGFLLAQCVLVLVFTRQGEEMLLWHENAIVFLPVWGNVSESNCDLGVIKSSMCLLHLLPTLFESYHFPQNDRWNVITSIVSLISAPPLVLVTLLKLLQIPEWVVQHVHTINGSRNSITYMFS